jgi:hypothetical protein
MRRIEIGGTDYPLKYGRLALSKTLKLAGAKSLKDAGKIDDLHPDKWGEFIYYGIETGCKVEGVDPPTIAQVEEALDLDLSLWSEAVAQFTDDLSGDKKPNTEGN